MTEYVNVDKQDEALNKLQIELDIDKDEDLEDILSNDFWSDVDGGTYLINKQKQQTLANPPDQVIKQK